jgi:tetratricopeptide (TPR) repeat protein
MTEFAKVIESEPKNLDAHLKLAELFFLAKRYSESRLLVDKILKDNPKNVDGLSLSAQLFVSQNDNVNAEKQIRKAIEIMPDSARLYLTKAEVFTAVNNLGEAELALHKALDLEPDNPQFNESIVKFYVSQNKADKAIEVIKSIISRKPEVASLRIILSQLYERGKQFEKAEESIKSVMEVDPSNYTSYLVVGNFYNRLRKYQDAENYYNQAYVKAVNTEQSIEVKGVLADFFLSRQDTDKAKKAVEEIFKVNPDSRMGNLLKARILSAENQHQKALALLNEKFHAGEYEYDKAVAYAGVGELKNAEKSALVARDKNKNDDRPQALLAQIALLNGNPANAEKLAADTLKKNINNYSAALTLGKALTAQGKYDKALTHFMQMNSFDPNNVEIMLNLGVVQLSLKKDKDAQKTFESILSSKPDHYLALSYLVRIYSNRNDLVGAVKRVEAQMKKVPDNSGFMMLLGKLQFDGKLYSDALKTFRNVQDLKPDDVEASVMAAKTLARLGEHKKVIAEYKSLIEKKPELKTAYLKLGSMMEQDGDVAGAEAVYEKALQKFPNYGPVANNLACLLMNKPNPDLDKAMVYASMA